MSSLQSSIVFKKGNNENNVSNFENTKVKNLDIIYSDEVGAKNNFNKSHRYASQSYSTAQEVRDALDKGLSKTDTLIETSKEVYATNPIYSKIINYYSNLFLWRYLVIPHKIEFDNKRKIDKTYGEIYNQMLSLVEGLNLQTKIPYLLRQNLIEGAVFFTTSINEETMTINTLILPTKYCKFVGSTTFGTLIVSFNYSYFDSLGLTNEQKDIFLDTFPDEFKKGYTTYLGDRTNSKWQTLDPRFSSGLQLNEKNIPVLFYSYGSTLSYEHYEDNELQRSDNALKYIVGHKMPIYENMPIFETEEVRAIHNKLAAIVNTSDKARLITTYGDLNVHKIQDNDTAENKTLINAYRSIYNDCGINNNIFTGDSVESLVVSLESDKSWIWSFVEQLMVFYNLAINNLFDFGEYQADLSMLQISRYSYNADLQTFKDNATVGVGKLDFMIASGIKQKHIQDRSDLENFLNLQSILTPLNSSYTQSGTNNEGSQPNKTTEAEETIK